jgi:hypothetical protein
MVAYDSQEERMEAEAKEAKEAKGGGPVFFVSVHSRRF